MAEKPSPDAVLKIAAQLFISTPFNKIDAILDDTLEERREKRIDEFVKFYFQLRDKLKEDE